MSQIIPGPSGFSEVIGGNTAGVTASVSSGTLSLVAGSNITLSQNANTLTLNVAGAATVDNLVVNYIPNTSAGLSQLSASCFLQPFDVPANLRFCRLVFEGGISSPNLNMTSTTAVTGAVSVTGSRSLVLYSTNATGISTFASTTNTYFFNISASSSVNGLTKEGTATYTFSFPSNIDTNGAITYFTSSRSISSTILTTNTSSINLNRPNELSVQNRNLSHFAWATSLSPGRYYLGLMHTHSAVVAGAITVYSMNANVPLHINAVPPYGSYGSSSSATIMTTQAYLQGGMFSVTTTSPPVNISYSEITNSFGSAMCFEFIGRSL